MRCCVSQVHAALMIRWDWFNTEYSIVGPGTWGKICLRPDWILGGQDKEAEMLFQGAVPVRQASIISSQEMVFDSSVSCGSILVSLRHLVCPSLPTKSSLSLCPHQQQAEGRPSWERNACPEAEEREAGAWIALAVCTTRSGKAVSSTQFVKAAKAELPRESKGPINFRIKLN